MKTYDARHMLDVLYGREPVPTPDGPDDAWCEQCELPATQNVTTRSGRHSLCDAHATDLRYRVTSAAWRARD